MINLTEKQIYKRKWHQDNKAKEQIYKRKWRQDNKCKCRNWQNLYRRNYPYQNVDNFLKTILKNIDIKICRGTIRQHSMLSKHSCTINFQYLKDLYIKQGGKCAITQIPMTYDKSLLAISVDRINSEMGYVPENIQLVCRWINLAKNIYTNEDIQKVLELFVNIRNEKYLCQANIVQEELAP